MTRFSIDRLDWIKWRCRTCGAPHHEMFNLDAVAPWHWGGPIDPEPNGALRMDGYFLSEDFCVIEGEHFFVRGVMDIPVEGSAHPLAAAQRDGIGVERLLEIYRVNGHDLG